MKASIYLVIQGKDNPYFAGRKDLGAVKVCKTKPNVAKDEISIKVDLDIPNALFEKPSLKIDVSIPDGAAFGSEITTEVTDNLAEVIKAQTGLSVTISPALEEVDNE